MKAVYPGSFDPLTCGHLDIIQRAHCLCNELVVAVLENVEKQYLLSTQERMDIIRESTYHLPKVRATSFRGLVVNLAHEMEADALVRGMRDIGDFRFEWETALVNRSLGNVETMFLLTDPRYAFVSSSRIKEIARWQGDISNLVPQAAVSRIRQACGEKLK